MFLLTRAIIEPTLFSDPRFWAEEGSNYYTVALHKPFFEYVTSYVFRGNFQFLTNLATGLAAQVAPLHAPKVTSFLSMLIFAGVVLQFGYYLRENGVTFSVSMLAMLAWTASPLTIEIFATATNLQWVVAPSVAIICLSRLDSTSKASLAVMCLWIAICGLTGVPSLFLTPFFLIQAYLLRSRNHLILFAVLFACGLIQASVILNDELSERHLVLGMRLLLAPMMLKTISLPLLGVTWTDDIASSVKEGGALAFILLAGGCAIFIGWLLHLNRYSWKAFLIIAIWASVSIIQTAGAIGPIDSKLMAISALAGARYCITGYFAVIVLLALSTRGAAQGFIFSLLVLIAVQGLSGSFFETEKHAGMPSWSAELAKCHSGETCTVTIWPGGDWVSKIPY